MDLSRRNVLAAAALGPLAVFAGGASSAAETASCYDPAALTLSQRNRRRSLAYVEVSADPKKTCAGCAFFTAATQSGCGTCQMLTGGPVKAGAVCGSFAAKAAR